MNKPLPGATGKTITTDGWYAVCQPHGLKMSECKICKVQVKAIIEGIKAADTPELRAAFMAGNISDVPSWFDTP